MLRLAVSSLLVVALGCNQETPTRSGQGGSAAPTPTAAGGGQVASCNTPKVGACREWRGDVVSSARAQLEETCAGTTGNPLALEPCPTQNIASRCTTEHYTNIFYTNHPMSPQELERACTELGGVFRAH